MKKIIFLLIIVTQFAFSQYATFDSTFLVGSGSPNGEVMTIKKLSDGKLLVAGYLPFFNGVDLASSIVKLNADGTIDNSFQAASGINESYTPIRDIISLADGSIVVCGSFLTYAGIERKNLLVLYYDGSLNLNFNHTGFGNSIDYGPSIKKLEPSEGGWFYVGGAFTTYNGINIRDIMRVNLTGALDASFVSPFDFDGTKSVWAISRQNDGKIIVGGNLPKVGGVSHGGIVRLNTDGSLDTTFNYLNTGANDFVTATAIQNDGKILFGGSFQSYNGTPINRIARLNTDGSLDASFNVGTGASDNVDEIIIQNDGKILIGGYFNSFNGVISRRLARLNSDGSLDTTFNVGEGVGTNFSQSIRSISIQDDNKIIIGGSFAQYQNQACNSIARLNSNTLSNSVFTENQFSKFSVYPNPTTSILNIQTQINSTIDKIVITDLTGKKVFEQNNANQVNVANLAKGLYVIEAFSGEEKFVQKFIKE